MSVMKEPSGRRSVEVEVIVPGTPEEVWRAIATGPGISAWFVPSDVDEREGGKAVCHFSPDGSMDSVSTITDWDPPRSFVAESADLGPDAPPVATEWIVEARHGGTCVVRVVHSLFASGDDWDGQLEGWEAGWPAFFRILRLYLTHFRGQSGAAFQLIGVAPEPKADAWGMLAGRLGFGSAAVGQRVSTAPGAPPLAGLVEEVGPAEHPEELLLRLDEPALGIAHLFALPMGGQVYLPIRLYLYGDRAASVAAREEPRWQAWITEYFAPTGVGSPAG
ncbi:MAG: SRPBCC domain-containing protein [Chloroflexota bacterium]|nr:SRPBCC domain-containing protein [Chloroflexota bacterium]